MLDGHALLIGELLLDAREGVAAVAPRVDGDVMHQVLRLRGVGKRERDFDLERDEPAVGADSGVIRVHVDNFGSFHDHHGGRCVRAWGASGARVGVGGRGGRARGCPVRFPIKTLSSVGGGEKVDYISCAANWSSQAGL